MEFVISSPQVCLSIPNPSSSNTVGFAPSYTPFATFCTSLITSAFTMDGAVDPQPNVDYSERFKNWTIRESKKFYHKNQHKDYHKLWDEAKELVTTYHVYPAAFSEKSPKPLANARQAQAHVLESHWKAKLSVRGQPEFLGALCLGAIKYASTLHKDGSKMDRSPPLRTKMARSRM